MNFSRMEMLQKLATKQIRLMDLSNMAMTRGREGEGPITECRTKRAACDDEMNWHDKEQEEEDCVRV